MSTYIHGEPAPEHWNEGPAPTLPEGFPFGPDSPLRRRAEPATFGYIPYIAGLAVMNDSIAAAVNEHSEVFERPWGRLFGTAASAAMLVFGDEEETVRRAGRLWHFHNTVEGNYEGVEYSANDPALQRHVLVSVFLGLQEANRRCAKPFGDDRPGVYLDFKRFGTMFGIPESTLPANVRELDDHWEDTVRGDFLLQTDVSYQMAQRVFRFTTPKAPRAVTRLGQAVWITSLDSRLQEKADLRPNEVDLRLARGFDAFMRNTYGRTPQRLRQQAIPAMLTAYRGLTMVMGRMSALSRTKRGPDGASLV